MPRARAGRASVSIAAVAVFCGGLLLLSVATAPRGPRTGGADVRAPADTVTAPARSGPSSGAGGAGLRVVSLVPGASALLVALGGAHLVVGRGTDDDTPELADRPTVGRVLTPGIESIVALEPDVVVVWAASNHGLGSVLRPPSRLLRVRLDRLADAPRVARSLGVAVGLAPEGSRLAEDLEGELERARARPSACPGASVAWAVGYAPPIAAGAATHLDDLLTHIGVANAFGDAASWPRLSLEALVARPVDLLVWPVGPELPPFADLPAGAPWRRTEVGRAGRVLEVDASLMHEVGPRIGVALTTLSRLVEAACHDHELPHSTRTRTSR